MKALIHSTIAALLIITACKQKTPPQELINQQASLPSTFSIADLHQKVLASFINKKDCTMSILYGDAFAESVLKSNDSAQAGKFSFTLVTWRQQEDHHWFGARIPGELLSVERLTQKAADRSPAYQKLSGKQLTTITDTAGTAARIRFILSQKPSILP